MGKSATGAVSVLAIAALTLSAAPAAAQVSGAATANQLAKAVTKKSDVKKYWSDVTTVQAPVASTSQTRIPVQGVCQYLSGGSLATKTVKLPKKQAWSDYRIGLEQRKGLISILNEYKTKKKAKQRYRQVKQALKQCPGGPITVDGSTLRMSHTSVKVKHGRAVGVYQTTTAAQDSIVYAVIHRTGKALSFVRYSETGSWFGGPPSAAPSKVTKSTRKISNKVSHRYVLS